MSAVNLSAGSETFLGVLLVPRMRILAIMLAFLVVCVPFQGPRAEEVTFAFENAEIETVIKSVSELTGLMFLFDPEEVKGKITLLSSTGVSPEKALELLESALALHDYRLLQKKEGVWIVIADPADAISAAYYNVWMAPYYGYCPANSLIRWYERRSCQGR